MYNEAAVQNLKEIVDVESLLLMLGFKVNKAINNEIRAPCVIHGGDNPTAFSIKLDTRKWRCFTHKCELDAQGALNNDIISLVMLTQRVPFKGAIQFLENFTGTEISQEEQDAEEVAKYSRQKDMNSFVREVNLIKKRKNLLNEISPLFLQQCLENKDEYFIKKGFLEDTLAVFEIGTMIDSKGVKRTAIPIRDHKGTLVSISGRRQDGNDEPRYLLLKNFQKDKVLYNLFMAKHSGEDFVIIVEGFKAAWAVVEAGFFNVVACMGSVVTEGQAALLCSTHFTRCVLMLDGDAAGRKGMETSISLLNRGLNTIPIYLPIDRSPDDFDRNELREYINNYL